MSEGFNSGEVVRSRSGILQLTERLGDMITLLRSRWFDWLRYGGVASECHALLLIARVHLRAALFWTPTTSRSLLAWSTALRRTRWRWLRAHIERHIEALGSGASVRVWREKRVGWDRLADEMANPQLVKSIILKSPGPSDEKGVLYISFEVNWLRLMKHHDLGAILGEYYLVGASSSSPPDYASLLALGNLSSDPAFVQISNDSDMEWMRVCAPWVSPVPILASDWLNPEWYRPKDHRSRSIDILMVAGWARFKSHWILFRALRKTSARFRTVLIGQDMDGRTADDVWREAKAAGVARRIEIIRDATPSLVTAYQCDSRVSVSLSRREGSGVVVAESFFADTPVVMMRGAHVGSARYINPSTGRFSTPATLAHDLLEVVERSTNYRARDWALKHITFDRSTAKLNKILKDHTIAKGGRWTRDIVPLCWRPDPVYANAEDAAAFTASYDALYQKYAVRFRDLPPSVSGRDLPQA